MQPIRIMEATLPRPLFVGERRVDTLRAPQWTLELIGDKLFCSAPDGELKYVLCIEPGLLLQTAPGQSTSAALVPRGFKPPPRTPPPMPKTKKGKDGHATV